MAGGINGAGETIVSERLAIIRNAYSLTQAEFAEKIGVKTRTYRNYELAVREVPLSVVADVVCVFREVDLVWLVFGIAPDGDQTTVANQKTVEMVEAAVVAVHEHFASESITASAEELSLAVGYVFRELSRVRGSGDHRENSSISSYLKSLSLFSKRREGHAQ